MVAEIDDLDAVADEFEVDGVDGAVVPVADGHGGQQADAAMGGGMRLRKIVSMPCIMGE